MIDIHSHIIPNVDDGARSVEETFNILKEAQEAGFTDVILTSHFLLNYYETNAQELIFWKEKLQEVLKKQGTKINLHSGMEIYITNQMEELLENKKILTLANSRYMLIELPLATNVKYFDYVVYYLEAKGIKPIIAHPERYKCVQKDPDIVEEYIEKGCLIQCNYGSIVNLYGREAEKTIKTLLKKNQVHFLGSDVHRENGTYLIILDAIKKIRKIIGENKINELTTINPKKILQNEEWQY
ncbi:MAG: capsular biosynthesis protein [Clostridia bacterium]|jgi:Capsular polysaccharide biosynthesis protein|nr:capsular biosynthesis protein [Clostridia bacterium]HCF64764.1 capsular biosynthesis protein [Clostridiales bacterium]